MIVDVFHITSASDFQRIKRLPFPGLVLVKEGQSVQPNDVIAETETPAKVIALDISRGLGISTSEAVSCLTRDLGEDLKQGDVVAQFNGGAFPRLVRSPVDGKFVEYHLGNVILATGRNLVKVHAGIFGVVDEIIPEYGARIRAQGILLQGVWGKGGTGTGSLQVIESSFKTPLNETMLDPVYKEQLVIAGQCLHADVLYALSETGLAGLVLCSLAPELVPMVEDLGLPVLILQGFGNFPSDQAFLSLLQAHSGKTGCVKACPVNVYRGERPEVFIPAESDGRENPPGFRADLAVGQRIRLLSGNACGRNGEVVGISNEVRRFESGLVSKPVSIRLQNGEVIEMPCQNVVWLAD